MTDIEFNVLGKKVSLGIGTSIFGIIMTLVGFGVVIQQARDTQELAKNAASKSDVAAIRSQMGQNMGQIDSTLKTVIRLDERLQRIDMDVQDLKSRVRDVEVRSYRSSNDRKATEPAQGHNGRSLTGEWNVMEQGSKTQKVQ